MFVMSLTSGVVQESVDIIGQQPDVEEITGWCLWDLEKEGGSVCSYHVFDHV